MMGLAQDASPINNIFGLIGLSFVVDCYMFLNIVIIKSPSREMGGQSDAATAMIYLSGPISLALSGNRSSHRCKERRSGKQICGRI